MRLAVPWTWPSIGPARRWSPTMSATPSGASRPVQSYLKWLRGQHQSFDRFRSLFPVSAESRLVNMVGLGIWPGRLLCIFPPDEQFSVRLSLKEWQWKLSGIDLPAPMRMWLAQQLVKQQKEKKRNEARMRFLSAARGNLLRR